MDIKNSSFGENSEDTSTKNKKLIITSIVVLIIFVVYALNLFVLQIINGAQYRNRSVTISRTVTTLSAQRGEIFDRNATLPMVINTDSFAVDLIPGEIPAGYYDTVSTKLAGYLGISKSVIDKKIPRDNRKAYKSYEIKNNVTFEQISNIAENITDLPGVSWRNKPLRNYVETGSISHILGYVGDIDSEELIILHNQGYDSKSIVGKAGIEKQYDSLLQGTPGRESKTVDATGKSLNYAPIIEPPKMGKNLVLTIDTSIQTLAEKALGDRVGAVVVLKPGNGEILAMVSYPYFDANLFSQDDATSQRNKLLMDPNHPMINRAVYAVYPPASTFKTIMTTAILSQHNLPAEQKIDCPGKIQYGDRVFNCHKKTGHGKLDLKNALAQSCDVYYWVAGRDYLGVDVIASYAREFGFGQKLNIDLPSQLSGFVPTASWKKNELHSTWLGGDTMNMSIGQGYTTVTPLHVADMMAMVCNSGKIYKPHLLKEVRDSATDEVIETIEPEVMLESTVAPEVWKEVQQDLRYMITNGTAVYPMGNKTVEIAGKTGTAEVNGYGPEHWHSWMVAYAPFNAPVEDQVVVCTLVEAVNDWEWWAPYATNIIIQGIFNDQTFDEAVDALGFKYLKSIRGRQE